MGCVTKAVSLDVVAGAQREGEWGLWFCCWAHCGPPRSRLLSRSLTPPRTSGLCHLPLLLLGDTTTAHFWAGATGCQREAWPLLTPLLPRYRPLCCPVLADLAGGRLASASCAKKQRRLPDTTATSDSPAAAGRRRALQVTLCSGPLGPSRCLAPCWSRAGWECGGTPGGTAWLRRSFLLGGPTPPWHGTGHGNGPSDRGAAGTIPAQRWVRAG